MKRTLCMIFIVGLVCSVPAFGDITFEYSTTGATITQIGANLGEYPNTTWDELVLTGISHNSVKLALGVPVIADLNVAIFSTGVNRNEAASATGDVTRTLNSLDITNPWTVYVSYFDTLVLDNGTPIFDGGVKITPLGHTFVSDGSYTLQGQFEYVPEPGVASVLLTMLAGCAGVSAVLKRRLQ